MAKWWEKIIPDTDDFLETSFRVGSRIFGKSGSIVDTAAATPGGSSIPYVREAKTFIDTTRQIKAQSRSDVRRATGSWDQYSPTGGFGEDLKQPRRDSQAGFQVGSVIPGGNTMGSGFFSKIPQRAASFRAQYLGSGSTPGVLPSLPSAPTVSGVPDVNRFPQMSGYGGKMNQPGYPGFDAAAYQRGIDQFIANFGGDPTTLKIFWRAPKGMIVLYDSTGQPWPVNKKAAITAGFFKIAKKPPISVKDYQALKGATRTINKLKKVGAMAEKIGGYKRVKNAPKKQIPRYIQKQIPFGKSDDDTIIINN